MGALFSILLPAYQHTDRVDIVIAIQDEVLRFPAEYTLRTAGLRVVSVNSFEDIHLLAAEYKPSVVILEQSGLCEHTVESINAVWPGVKLMAIGDPGSFKAVESVIFVPKPLDYARLVSQVREIISPFE